jgi:uncharacterized cofD-like protein
MATPFPLRIPNRRQIISGLQWLRPGLRVKRWLLLLPIGLFLGLLGTITLMQWNIVTAFDSADNFLDTRLHINIAQPSTYIPLGVSLLTLGLFSVTASLVIVNRSIVAVVAPDDMATLPEVIRRKRMLSQGAKIVVIGGGTGLSTLLRGLKQYSSNLTAVVTMTDDGGSSGRLKTQMGSALPPGDIRNCLVALADAEPKMQELFQYRFATKTGDDGLDGHNFGNLLIAAMTEITGDFEKAVEATSEILNIRGRVLPSTREAVSLLGEMADGRMVAGETNIVHDPSAIRQIRLVPERPTPPTEVLQAIREADVIVLGPGSVFTSVIPNLLVPEIAHALAESHALRVYACNVMTQPGETDNFTASDHLRVIIEHTAPFLPMGKRIMDAVLVNTERPAPNLLTRYETAGAYFVEPDTEKIRAMGYDAIRGTFMSGKDYVRHDPEAIALAIVKLLQKRK